MEIGWRLRYDGWKMEKVESCFIERDKMVPLSLLDNFLDPCVRDKLIGRS